MGLDLSTQLTKIDGTPVELQIGSSRDGEPATFRDLFVESLSVHTDNNISGDEKMKRYRLARRIYDYDGDEISLNLDEKALLKGLVGNMYAPVVVGQLWDALEQ